MHLNPVYLALELGAAGFFAWAALAALRRGRLPFLELASAAVFGILLEEGDQLIFQTYHYSPDFLLTIDRAPIVIGLTWALILAGAMRITDALGVRRRWAPFVDAILALSLDLAFDAIAIRIGLWTWSDLSLTDGWFGVPAGNFYAWLWVTFAFSLVTRLLRDAAAGQPRLELLQLLVPIPAYAILLIGLMPFSFLKPLVDPRPGGGLWLFGLTLVAFCAVGAYAVWGPDRAAPNGERTAILELGVSFTSRLAIHGFFLAALLVMGIAWKVPMLLLVALVLVGAEWPLARLVRGRGAAVAGQARVEQPARSGAKLPAELP